MVSVQRERFAGLRSEVHQPFVVYDELDGGNAMTRRRPLDDLAYADLALAGGVNAPFHDHLKLLL
jgi:hypothetical protein